MFLLVRLVKSYVRFSCSFYLDSAAAAAVETQQEEDGDRYDDSSAFHAKSESSGPFNNLRWSTRVFSMECVCRIIAQCENGDPAHFNMALAQEQRLHESAG